MASSSVLARFCGEITLSEITDFPWSLRKRDAKAKTRVNFSSKNAGCTEKSYYRLLAKRCGQFQLSFETREDPRHEMIGFF